ncbi:uncharacterized protein LOC132257398 [Phlebotomus argentipes]|uniref:uncharacterized protein LOC132257398 n=1 Tax=Phlebotomus argentipes TaxID=94469 RepID=UPI0028937E92|nr:uncharacterized protein LOC132257398 [Phlebotomus argentipes]
MKRSIASTSRSSREFRGTSESSRKKLKEEQQDKNMVWLGDALADDDEEVEQELELEKRECVPGENFTSQLARLVKTNDCPNDFTDNLLNLLRKNGHADLPSDKKSLVTEPPPPSDDPTLTKILDNQRLILRNQTLIMEQMKALARSHATQRIRLSGMSERLDKMVPMDLCKSSTHYFPFKVLDDFEDFDKKLADESFRTKVFSEISRAMQTGTWLFTMASDDVLHHYNLNGNFNKKSLRETNLLKVLEELFPENEFLRDRHIQALIKTCHARQNTKNSRSRASLRKTRVKEEVIDDSY